MANPPEEVQLWQTAEPVEFNPTTKDRNEGQSILISARQGVGYAVAAGQLSHAIQSRATHLLLDYSQKACGMRYQIDGSWEPLPPIDRETGDAMLYALKQLCQLNPADRRSSQQGKVHAKIRKDKFVVAMHTQGIPTGERVLIKIEAEKIPFETLADLGMRDKMVTDLRQQLNAEKSLVLITAPPGGGLTTTWQTAIESADRLIRDFQSFEDDNQPEPEIINVSPNYFGGDTGLTQMEALRKQILKEPDVMVFPEFPEPDTLEMAFEQVNKIDKQIYLRAKATSAIEGLVQLIARYPGLRGEFAKHTTAVTCQKLVRRLCDTCKVGFQPPPQLLQQLGIPQGRVSVLYQPFVPPPPEQQVDEQGRPAPIEPCGMCMGRGYFGRIGIFELLSPGEKLRDALTKSNDIGQLTQIAKTEGHRTLQMEAVMTVARGLTGLDELKRAFARA